VAGNFHDTEIERKVNEWEGEKMSIIENCVAIKIGIRERINYRRPVRGNAHRLALFLIFARKKAKNQKEILAAFQKGINAWKRFERQTAFYHIAKFLEGMKKEYQKRISLSATVGDQTKNPECVRVATANSHAPSDDTGGSGGDDDPDGDPDDPDSDHHRQIAKAFPQNDPSIQTGGVAHA